MAPNSLLDKDGFILQTGEKYMSKHCYGLPKMLSFPGFNFLWKAIKLFLLFLKLSPSNSSLLWAVHKRKIQIMLTQYLRKPSGDAVLCKMNVRFPEYIWLYNWLCFQSCKLIVHSLWGCPPPEIREEELFICFSLIKNVWSIVQIYDLSSKHNYPEATKHPLVLLQRSRNVT